MRLKNSDAAATTSTKAAAASVVCADVSSVRKLFCVIKWYMSKGVASKLVKHNLRAEQLNILLTRTPTVLEPSR